MINGIRNYYKKLILTFVGMSILLACTKKKTPTPVTPEPTKWEKIAGHYKVYDTTGVYLYDMDLVHKTGFNLSGYEEDSLIFENWKGWRTKKGGWIYEFTPEKSCSHLRFD